MTATDTSTPGYLRLTFHISGSLIFHEDFDILPASLYDSLVSGSIPVPANVKAISDDQVAADNLETMLDGSGGGTLSLGHLNVVADALRQRSISTMPIRPAMPLPSTPLEVAAITHSISEVKFLPWDQ